MFRRGSLPPIPTSLEEWFGLQRSRVITSAVLSWIIHEERVMIHTFRPVLPWGGHPQQSRWCREWQAPGLSSKRLGQPVKCRCWRSGAGRSARTACRGNTGKTDLVNEDNEANVLHWALSTHSKWQNPFRGVRESAFQTTLKCNHKALGTYLVAKRSCAVDKHAQIFLWRTLLTSRLLIKDYHTCPAALLDSAASAGQNACCAHRGYLNHSEYSEVSLSKSNAKMHWKNCKPLPAK